MIRHALFSLSKGATFAPCHMILPNERASEDSQTRCHEETARWLYPYVRVRAMIARMSVEPFDGWCSMGALVLQQSTHRAAERSKEMSWTELLTREIEYNYAVADKLMDLVDDGKLGWKPSTGTNWMTTGQVLMHTATACGPVFKGFITGDWGMPEGVEMSPEDMLPPAEKMPTVTSVAEAKRLLAEDKRMALQMLKTTPVK